MGVRLWAAVIRPHSLLATNLNTQENDHFAAWANGVGFMSGAGLARGRPRKLALAFVAAVGVGALDGYALSVGAVHGDTER